MRRLDFYTAAAPLAFIIGFIWVYLTMVHLKIPGWPGMVAMAAFYAVGGNACHEQCNNASQSIKALLLGVMVSWGAVFIWTLSYKGSPVAMAVVMGTVAAVFVLATKLRLLQKYPFIAMPQAFLGATIFFGLFNVFMAAKGVSPTMLFGLLQPLVIKGGAQPHVAGAIGILSVAIGVLLGWVHQKSALSISKPSNSQS